MKGSQFGFDYLKTPAAKDQWENVKLNQEQMAQLASWVRVINRLEVSDARRKSKELIAALRIPVEDFPQPLNAELNRFGFHKTAFEDEEYKFDATGGMFTFVSTDWRADEFVCRKFCVGRRQHGQRKPGSFFDDQRLSRPFPVSDAGKES